MDVVEKLNKSGIPSYAAVAMLTMSVMLGVSLTKNGIFTAFLTHCEMPFTKTGS